MPHHEKQGLASAAATPLITRGKALLPLILVVVSLASLALLPWITMQQTGRLRAHISLVAQPARAQVTRIQSAITLETAATRGYLLAGDPDAAADHVRARAIRDHAITELRPLTEQLNAQARSAAQALIRSLEFAEPLLDSLFRGRISRSDYTASLPDQQQRLQGVLAAAAEFDAAIGRDVASALGRVRRIEAIGAALTIVLVVLALVAAVLVANLTRKFSESEERFRQIAEAVHDAVSLTDARFTKQLFVNEAYERIWGRPRAELYANPLSLLDGVHPEDRERVRMAIGHLPEGTTDVEYRVVRPDGQERWVWSRAFPVRDARGEIYRVAGITEDITERKLAGESRIRLIRGFTHDVKNPLGAADGFLALLQDGVMGALAPPQLESVGRVRRSIRAALNLTSQLLDIARAEAGQLEIERTRLDLAAATREVVEDFRAEAQAKRLALSLELPEKEARELVIETDHARVRQILANLLSNAVKYTPPNGRIIVRAGSEQDGQAPDQRSWVTISVTDTGSGIPPEKQNMLFREFTRFNPGAAQGSGIGLAISQRVARALGATITVDSQPGAGSTFTLWLPMDLEGKNTFPAAQADG